MQSIGHARRSVTPPRKHLGRDLRHDSLERFHDCGRQPAFWRKQPERHAGNRLRARTSEARAAVDRCCGYASIRSPHAASPYLPRRIYRRRRVPSPTRIICCGGCRPRVPAVSQDTVSVSTFRDRRLRRTTASPKTYGRGSWPEVAVLQPICSSCGRMPTPDPHPVFPASCSSLRLRVSVASFSRRQLAPLPRGRSGGCGSLRRGRRKASRRRESPPASGRATGSVHR